MIAIPRAAFMRSVAVIVRQTAPVRCNDRERGPPSIAIRDADDCEPVQLPGNLQDSTTAEALQVICDFDLAELQSIEPPRGFGRD